MKQHLSTLILSALVAFVLVGLLGCAVDAPGADVAEAADLEARAECRHGVACDAIAGSFEPECVTNMTRSILQPCSKADDGSLHCTSIDPASAFPGDFDAFTACVEAFEASACSSTTFARSTCWP